MRSVHLSVPFARRKVDSHALQGAGAGAAGEDSGQQLRLGHQVGQNARRAGVQHRLVEVDDLAGLSWPRISTWTSHALRLTLYIGVSSGACDA